MAALLTLPVGVAHASEIVFLDFGGGGANDTEEQGARKAFDKSPVVGRLARAELGLPAIGPLTPAQEAALNQKAAQVATMMMDDIKTQLEAVYKGKWITFTKDKNTKGITKTIDFVAGVDDTAVPGSFGFFKKDKAWVLPDNFDKAGEVWIPAEGATPEADRLLNKAELTRALAKTAAHELGHMYLGAGHPANPKRTKAGEAPTKVLTLDPAPNKASIMSQGMNVSDLGAGGLMFSRENMKKIEKKIGTSADAGHKAPSKKSALGTMGTRDALTTDPDPGVTGVPRSGAATRDLFMDLLIGNDVMSPCSLGVSTDCLVGSSSVFFDLAIPGTPFPVLDAAFLDIGLWGVDAANRGGISLTVEGRTLMEAGLGVVDARGIDTTSPQGPFVTFDNHGTSNFFAEVAVLTLDLEDFFTLAELKTVLADGLLNVEVGFGAVPSTPIAIDFVEALVFGAPEPAPVLLIAIGLIPPLVWRCRPSALRRPARDEVKRYRCDPVGGCSA